jgi:hypothetical protein
MVSSFIRREIIFTSVLLSTLNVFIWRFSRQSSRYNILSQLGCILVWFLAARLQLKTFKFIKSKSAQLWFRVKIFYRVFALSLAILLMIFYVVPRLVLSGFFTYRGLIYVRSLRHAVKITDALSPSLAGDDSSKKQLSADGLNKYIHETYTTESEMPSESNEAMVTKRLFSEESDSVPAGVASSGSDKRKQQPSIEENPFLMSPTDNSFDDECDTVPLSDYASSSKKSVGSDFSEHKSFQNLRINASHSKYRRNPLHALQAHTPSWAANGTSDSKSRYSANHGSSPQSASHSADMKSASYYRPSRVGFYSDTKNPVIPATSHVISSVSFY